MESKEERYEAFIKQLRHLVEIESDSIAVMANTVALLHEDMGFFWTGFYRVLGDKLVLGPFQGPIACTRIPYGKGVCGTSWKEKATIVVEDVEQFPGHIACSSQSKSEIVVPVFGKDDEVVAVIDIDSDKLSYFDSTDARYLEEASRILCGKI